MKDSRACPCSSNQTGRKAMRAATEHRFIKPARSYHNLIKGVGRVPAAGRAAG